MIGLVQRVTQASVTVNNDVIGKIGKGMVVLVGVEQTDSQQNIEKLANKLAAYRMFSDDEGKMNLNVQQIEGEILLVSQFTLVADTAKGNRPGFSKGASPEHGKAMFDLLVETVKAKNIPVATGQFGADMQVSLINDGPVTFHFNL